MKEAVMAKTKYVKSKDGKFSGSIGAGRENVPTGRAPLPLAKALTVQSHPASAPTALTIPYNPAQEADKVMRALEAPRGLFGRRAQNKLRAELEARFGAIDWTNTSTV
jgi:hypothetical protein